MNMQSSLSRHVESGPKTPAEVKEECRKAWHRDGLICLRSEWFNSWADRKQAELLAEKQFGKRREQTQ